MEIKDEIMEKCQSCGKETVELCQDGYCKDCHVSISWESCTSGSFNAQYLLKNGHTVEEIKKLYTNAKL